MIVAVTGSHGLIGSALATRLRADGHEVVAVARDAEGRFDTAALRGTDAVVHLAGVGIADRRWNDDHKQMVRESRVSGTTAIARAVADLDPRPVLLSGSAIGYYGNRGDTEITESSPPGDDFLSSVCVDWEAATAPAEQAGARVVHLRTGIVLAAEGGALKKQLPIFKAGLGGRLGSGRQYTSWISIADEIGAIIFAITDPAVAGPINLTAPDPVTNAEFTKALGRALHRPAALVVPAFALRAAMGTQMADEMLLSGARVLPRVLQQAGYRFAHPRLDEALQAVLAN